MTLHQLRIFLTVAQSATLTRASKQLGLAQPSLSKQLAGLEESVGTRLFDRGHNRMVLTDAGRVLLRLPLAVSPIFTDWLVRTQPTRAPRVEGLMTEVDEQKRMAGYRALSQEASEKSWVVPLLQAVTTIAYRSNIDVKTFDSGYILPVEYKRK